MICGKVIYPTIRDAVDAIKGLMNDNQDRNATFRSNKLPSRAYFCDDCQGYHLHTENKKQVVKKIKAQRTKSEIDSDHSKHEIKRERQTLIIHDRLKFKIK